MPRFSTRFSGPRVPGSGRSWLGGTPSAVPAIRAPVHPADIRATVPVHLRDGRGPLRQAAQGDNNVAGLTLNQIFADLNQYLTTDIVPWLQSDAAVAKQYGVPLVAYEGGQGLAPGANDLNSAVMQQAQNDPRMYQFYIAMIKDWQQAGGGLFNDYQLDRPRRQIRLLGDAPTVLATGSQKYDALMSMIEPAGDANLDGIVDYADFQTLEANYGDTNAYWEQGDFNDDGTVNWQDLNILRQNLDPAGFTLSQFAQQAVFGQLSTVIPGQSLEYDGYGVTYASSLPFAASSGTVKLNENSQGTAIVLGGATYSEGLGVLANSSISLALNGQYSQFESTIGVDGSSNTGSSVIFDVYGDGQLLYQSPTLTYASGAVPIDVNVAGVTTLTLTVVGRPRQQCSSRPRGLGGCPAGFDGEFRINPALYPDLAAFAERHGPVHADHRFLRLRRHQWNLYTHIDRHRRTRATRPRQAPA